MSPLPLMPVQPALIERITDAADTSAGRRKYFENIALVFDVSTTSGLSIDALQISRLAGAATTQLNIEPTAPADLTRPIAVIIDSLANRSVREQAESLLRELRPILLRAARDSDLPPLRATETEDGTALIEWVFADRRLGFSLEKDPKDSGWYFVSSRSSGGVLASGDSSTMDLELLVTWAKTHGTKRRAA